MLSALDSADRIASVELLAACAGMSQIEVVHMSSNGERTCVRLNHHSRTRSIVRSATRSAITPELMPRSL